jgi:hypothetical protein
MTSFEYICNQGPGVGSIEIAVPVMSVYSRGRNIGMTISDYLERNIPATKFQFSNGWRHFVFQDYNEVANWDEYPCFEIVHSHIGMRGQKPCETGIKVFFHEGGWRPGFGKVVNEYKEFFFPPVRETWDRAGCFKCGNIYTSENTYALKYLEVHGHFPWYGHYFIQEEQKEWSAISYLERRLRAGRKPDDKGPKINPGLIDDRLTALKKAGISPHWYINFSDGYRPEVEKRWPESIAKKSNGAYAPSGWRFCHLMNPDPSLPFGKHIISNAKKVIERYPQLDGFFLDCFRHLEFDPAHDDGVTMVNNKPAYNISWGLGRLQEEISKACVPQKKDCFANKPRTIYTMRRVDGVLLEGQGDTAEGKYFWTCIAKPLYYMWTRSNKPVEEYLKRSILLGGWPKTERGQLRKLYEAYVPLYEHFRNRVLCFEKNPVRCAQGLYGQLYTLPDGSYIAGVITDWASVFDKGKRTVIPPFAAIHVKEWRSLGEIYVHYPGKKEKELAEYYRAPGGWVTVPLFEFKSAAVVIFKKGNKSKNRGMGEFPSWEESFGRTNPIISPENTNIPRAQVPAPRSVLVIDGSLEDKAWKSAPPLIMRKLRTGEDTKFRTEVRVLADAKALYIGFTCFEPAMDKLRARVKEHDGQVWGDDEVEVFLSSGEKSSDSYFQFIFNSLGTVFDGKGKDYTAWNAAGIKTAAKKYKDKWTVEAMIPWKDLVKSGEKPSTLWRANFNRYRTAKQGSQDEDQAWSPTLENSNHVPSRFGHLTFKVFE